MNPFPLSPNVRNAIESNNHAVKSLVTDTYENVPSLFHHIAVGWRYALCCFMYELRQLENAQLPLEQDQGISRPPVAEMQSLTELCSLYVDCSYQHPMVVLDDPRESTCHSVTGFVFAKVFKIRSITSPYQVEIGAACVMFNAALTNHLADLRRISTPFQVTTDSNRPHTLLHNLLEAAHLYRLVLKILEQSSHDATALTLSVVVLNNYAAVLIALGPSHEDAARNVYYSLFRRLSEIDEVQSNSVLLDVLDTNKVYKACLSIIFQIDYTITAPAA
jgi:hypothetical protein